MDRLDDFERDDRLQINFEAKIEELRITEGPHIKPVWGNDIDDVVKLRVHRQK
jgi:hypothetical protein